MPEPHKITFHDGEVEECSCSYGEDHTEDEGDWNLF